MCCSYQNKRTHDDDNDEKKEGGGHLLFIVGSEATFEKDVMHKLTLIRRPFSPLERDCRSMHRFKRLIDFYYISSFFFVCVCACVVYEHQIVSVFSLSFLLVPVGFFMTG